MQREGEGMGTMTKAMSDALLEPQGFEECAHVRVFLVCRGRRGVSGEIVLGRKIMDACCGGTWTRCERSKRRIATAFSAGVCRTGI